MDVPPPDSLPPPPPPPPLTKVDKMCAVNIKNLTEYERNKILNVMRNNEVFRMHNLPALATGLREEFKKMKGKEKMQEAKENTEEESDHDYIPDRDEQSEDETLKKSKKVCRCSVLGSFFL